jgi:hypothetical protein
LCNSREAEVVALRIAKRKQELFSPDAILDQAVFKHCDEIIIKKPEKS